MELSINTDTSRTPNNFVTIGTPAIFLNLMYLQSLGLNLELKLA